MKPLLLLSIFLSPFLCRSAAAAPTPPNVLFIIVDDMNDWVGCLGGHPQVKTPHIDRLPWGKPAAWCDYSRVMGGKHAGIMIIPDPVNPHPSWWHKRDYGVFVSNPFGRKFMKQGEAYRLRHTIILHSGSGAVGHGRLLQ